MNTDQPDNNQSQIPVPDNNSQQVNDPAPAPNSDQPKPLADLVDALQSVDTEAPEAGLNATSIDDNNGGRLELNEDPPIKK